MTRTAVVLDRRPLWRNAFEQLLGTAGIRVVAIATDPEHLIDVMADQRPDVVIVDVEVDDAERTLDAIRRTRLLHPDVRMVAFARTAEDEKIDAAFTAGVRVFCIKTAETEDLVTAVRQAFQSSIFVARATADGTAAVSSAAATTAARLTKREQEILRLVADGHSNADVARDLWVTQQTIKFHLSNVYRKLGVANRTEASRWAQLHGVLSPTEDEPAAAASQSPGGSVADANAAQRIRGAGFLVQRWEESTV